MSELVSIIIPTYNRSETLCRAISSAVNQEYTDVEVVVVNDGGDEKTTQNVVGDFVNVKLIHQSVNKGVSAARNAGIRAATGDYLLFLDDDDELDPNFLSQIIAEKDLSAEVIIGFAQLKGDYSDPHFKKIKRYNEILYSTFHNSPPASWNYFLQYMPAIHSMVFKVDVFKMIQFDEEINYGEDRLLMLNLQNKNVPIQVTQFCAGYYYYKRSNYSSKDVLAFIVRSRLEITSGYGISYTHLLEAYLHVKNSNFGLAIRSMIHSFKSPYVVVKQFLLFLRLIKLR